MSNIPPIAEWRRIFIDTSFIIDLLRDLKSISPENPKYETIEKSQKLLEHFKLVATKEENKIRWITSSIVLSELIKFETKEIVDELQNILNSPEVEIINFTKKEANFIVNDMGSYVQENHISRYIQELQKEMGNTGVFNPRNFVSKDALIIACAKSKPCDVVLTSDKNTFVPMAKKVDLPILLTEDLILDLHGNIDPTKSISTAY